MKKYIAPNARVIALDCEEDVMLVVSGNEDKVVTEPELSNRREGFGGGMWDDM